MSVQVIRFAPGLKPVLKHQEHDQSTHGSWADSGSPKLTIMGKNDGTNEFFNENTRVVRYQPEGKAAVDYVLVVDDLFSNSSVVAYLRPTDGTTIDGNPESGFGNYKQKPVGVLEATGAGKNPWRESAKDDNKGTVVSLVVNVSHRRRGLASAMLKFHRDTYPELDIQHSHALTEDGEAFATVVKHGSHDQKTHGSWADGVASPEAGSADQEAMYKYIYEEKGFVPLENPPLKEGEKPEKYQSDYDLVRDWEDINNERISDGLEPIDFYAIEQSPVMTKWEFKALRSYLGSGAVEHINPWLRSTRAIYPEEKNVTTLKIASLDSLISKVPEVRSETPLFRMFNKNVVEKMEIGQVFKDRGFLSTSFADVTDPKNIKLRNEMNFMQPTGVIGRIVPNGHYSGLSVNHVQQDMFYKHEKEFLMPRGSEFRYLGLGKTPSGETVMDFERLSG